MEWFRRVAKPIEEATGTRLYAFDPGWSLRFAGGGTVHLESREFVERLSRALETGEKPPRYEEEWAGLEKQRKERERRRRALRGSVGAYAWGTGAECEKGGKTRDGTAGGNSR